MDGFSTKHVLFFVGLFALLLAMQAFAQ